MSKIRVKNLTQKNIWVLGAKWTLFAMGIYAVGAATPSHAQERELTVKLEDLVKVSAQSNEGTDELYINVTEFPAQGRARHYQVPEFPAHWLSRDLSQVKDIVLWKKKFQSCEPTELLISLVEEDLPPWNPNDLLGAVQLKINCQNGKLVSTWSVPNANITAALTQPPHAYSFTGEKMQYQAIFKLENIATQKSTVSVPAKAPAKAKAKVRH